MLRSLQAVRHGVSCTHWFSASLQLSVVHSLKSSQLRSKWKQMKAMQWSVLQKRPSSQSLSLRHCAAAGGGPSSAVAVTRPTARLRHVDLALMVAGKPRALPWADILPPFQG